MRNKRLIQFAISFLIVCSLFASSVSACACKHHQEKLETENVSCHHDLTMAGMEMENKDAEQFAAASENGCNCVQPAFKIFAKNEIFKVQKYSAAVPPIINFEIKNVSPVIEVEKIDFKSLFYLSDSSYNFSHERAPPRL